MLTEHSGGSPEGRWSPLTQGASPGGDSAPPQGTLGMSGDIFGGFTSSGAPGVACLGARDGAQDTPREGCPHWCPQCPGRDLL